MSIEHSLLILLLFRVQLFSCFPGWWFFNSSFPLYPLVHYGSEVKAVMQPHILTFRTETIIPSTAGTVYCLLIMFSWISPHPFPWGEETLTQGRLCPFLKVIQFQWLSTWRCKDSALNLNLGQLWMVILAPGLHIEPEEAPVANES